MKNRDMLNSLQEVELNNGTIRMNTESMNKTGKKKLFSYSLKKRFLQVVLGASVLLSLIGCGKKDNTDDAPAAVVVETTSEEDNHEQDVIEIDTLDEYDDYELDDLFDRVSVTSITNNMKTPEEIAQEISASIGGTYTGPTTTVTSESGKTSTWVSEKDAEIAKETGLLDAPAGETVVTVDGNYTIGADGDVYVSKDAANRESHNNGVVSTSGLTGTEYTDSQTGEQWENKGEYDSFQNGAVITDGPGVGTVVEKGDGYEGDNGELWESRRDYLEDLYGEHYNYDDGYYDEYDDGYYDDGYYDDDYVDDYYGGGYYDEDYVFVDENNDKYVRDELGGYTDKNGQYHIDGGVYASKEIYLEIKDLPVTGEDDTSYEYGDIIDVQPSYEDDDEDKTPVYDELGGYTDKEGYHIDGGVYPSKEVYLEIKDLPVSDDNNTSNGTGNVDGQQSTNGNENYVGDVVMGSDGNYQAPVYDELGGYQDKEGYHIDGGIYPSKEVYLEIKDLPVANENEETNVKTR